MSVAQLALLTGPKAEIEFDLKLGIAMLLFGLSLVNEYRTVGLPLARMRKFRERYLDDSYEKTWKGLLGEGFRLNVMYLRRPAKLLWLKAFEWSWSKNFIPPNHRDANMVLLARQGIAGLAVKTQTAKSDYFGPDTERKSLRAPYYLTPWQLARTADIKGILSVPILEKSSGPAQAFKCVGVINIDAMTDVAVEKLRKNEQALAAYFLEIGVALGDLSA